MTTLCLVVGSPAFYTITCPKKEENCQTVFTVEDQHENGKSNAGPVVAAEEVSVEMRVQETSLTICLQITVAIQTLAAEIIVEGGNVIFHLTSAECCARLVPSYHRSSV